eukprot:535158_1
MRLMFTRFMTTETAQVKWSSLELDDAQQKQYKEVKGELLLLLNKFAIYGSPEALVCVLLELFNNPDVKIGSLISDFKEKIKVVESDGKFRLNENYSYPSNAVCWGFYSVSVKNRRNVGIHT